jgi:hypothetical protein
MVLCSSFRLSPELRASLDAGRRRHDGHASRPLRLDRFAAGGEPLREAKGGLVEPPATRATDKQSWYVKASRSRSGIRGGRGWK